MFWGSILVFHCAVLFGTVPILATESSDLPVVSGLAGSLAHEHDLPMLAIRSAVTTAVEAAAADEGISVDFLACDRELSSCPAGWTELIGGACEAPQDYSGSCPAVVSYYGLTPAQKYAKCDGTHFPCKGDCIQDFAMHCPSGWSRNGKTCLAPSSYKGPCLGRKSFTTFGLADKRAWAQTCGAMWPCRPTAPRNVPSLNTHSALKFDEDCPAGWVHDGRFCVAPARFHASKCGYHVDTSRFTRNGKREWASVCNVPWSGQAMGL